MLQKLEFRLEEYEDQRKDSCTSKVDEDGVFLVETNPESEFWKKYKEPEVLVVFAVKEIEPGIYETVGFNFDHDMNSYADYKEVKGSYGSITSTGLPVAPNWWRESDKRGEVIGAYGVADDIEQVKAKYKQAIENPDSRIVLSFVTLGKSEQPPNGGWCWHKWGEYIGTREPQCEYLYDEPEIDKVIVFSVHAVVKKE